MQLEKKRSTQQKQISSESFKNRHLCSTFKVQLLLNENSGNCITRLVYKAIKVGYTCIN